jgi:hypothetical protein
MQVIVVAERGSELSQIWTAPVANRPVIVPPAAGPRMHTEVFGHEDSYPFAGLPAEARILHQMNQRHAAELRVLDTRLCTSGPVRDMHVLSGLFSLIVEWCDASAQAA